MAVAILYFLLLFPFVLPWWVQPTWWSLHHTDRVGIYPAVDASWASWGPWPRAPTGPTGPTRPTGPTGPTGPTDASSKACGKINRRQLRIVGGEDAEKNEWPWMAAIVSIYIKRP